MRIVWKTSALIFAMISVWAVALGVVDRARPDKSGDPFQASPSARVEQRAALFAVTWDRAGSNVGPSTIGIATPIALVEPGGAIVSPITARTDEAALAEAKAFAETYFKPVNGLVLLRGGAAAGEVRFVGDPLLDGKVPVVPVAGSGPSDLGPLAFEATTLLAVTDRRHAGRLTGVRPMRDFHRAAVDEATRQVLRDRYPTSEIVEESVARVRVADLDRDGRTEVLASRVIRLRGESGLVENAILFLIAEPERATTAGESDYRISYVALQLFSDEGPPSDIVFIDQADLTSAVFDEIVVRLDEGGTSRYAVLRRDQTAWTQVSSTLPVRPRPIRQLAGEKSSG